jgi:hypothetical protein
MNSCHYVHAAGARFEGYGTELDRRGQNAQIRGHWAFMRSAAVMRAKE